MCAPSGGGGITISSDSVTSTVNQQKENIETLDNPWEDYKDALEEDQEDWQETQESWEDSQENLEDSAEAISDAVTESVSNTTEIASSVSKQLNNILNPQKPIASDDQVNAMASIEGDPRLASLRARMRRRRARGKSQLRKGGGLYIPLKAGIQVQT